MERKGFVYLVGAGPGDPGLFTIKGKELLEQAEVVVYDRLVSPAIIAWANPQAEMIYVGKESSRHTLNQDEINALLAEKAGQGKIVVRLKGGDPFVFGRGGEEALYVREHGFDFAVVPGITSAVAVPAYAGIPVTHRDATSSFAVITGHEKPGKETSSIHWDRIATGIGTLVFLMGVENLEYIATQLMEHGRAPETPVALVRRGTMPDQEVVTGRLDDIVRRVQAAGLKPPAIIVVGETVDLRQQLGWWETGPLWGKRILVTRSRAQASGLVKKIRGLGGEAIEFPTIEIEAEKNPEQLYQAFDRIENYNWIIFTSVNAVDIFFREFKGRSRDIRCLADIKLGAIGPATAARLQNLGLLAELIPDEFVAEGIIEKVKVMMTPGEKVLLPRARGARDVLPAALEKLGAAVEEIYLYQAVPPRTNAVDIEEILAQGLDYITFTSSSTVTNFVEILGERQAAAVCGNAKTVCIGPITAGTAREKGLKVDITAGEYTIDGLLQGILTDLDGN
ncbi:MAG TPA: uroporphyrinogen-III C-methyltransferase [Syntrophomonas sp.]|nr:uroporphyrinogen-III C-methyltransferase [Syntrophomonas sp.]